METIKKILKEEIVVYKARYGAGDVWVRPVSMWEEVIIKEGKTFKRFEKI